MKEVLRVVGVVVLVLSLVLAGSELVGAGSTVAVLTVHPEPGAAAHMAFRSDPATDLRSMVRTPTTYSADPYSTDVVLRPEGGAVEVAFIIRRGIRQLQKVESRATVGQCLTITASRWRLSTEVTDSSEGCGHRRERVISSSPHPGGGSSTGAP